MRRLRVFGALSVYASIYSVARSDDFSFLVIEAAEDNADDINNLPDEEASTREELNDAGDDFAGVDTVHAAEAAADEHAEQEGDETGTSGLIGAVFATVHIGISGLEEFSGAGSEGFACVIKFLILHLGEQGLENMAHGRTGLYALGNEVFSTEG